MCGINDQKVATVIFPSLPTELESAVQFAGEACRLSPFCARVHSTPLSSTITLRQRPDCYRDLDLPDRKRSCPDQSVRSSRDTWWVSLITLGEGYHNYHRFFSSDYRNGPQWYNVDPSK